MKKSNILLPLMVIIQGCAATPDLARECGDLFDSQRDIQRCEQRVEFAETLRIRKEQEELEKSLCYWPHVWDVRIKSCREWF